MKDAVTCLAAHFKAHDDLLAQHKALRASFDTAMRLIDERDEAIAALTAEIAQLRHGLKLGALDAADRNAKFKARIAELEGHQ